MAGRGVEQRLWRFLEACAVGDTEAVVRFLDEGVNPGCALRLRGNPWDLKGLAWGKGILEGDTALHVAVRHKKVDLVRLLLERCPQECAVNALSGGGFSALHLACCTGAVGEEMLQILLASSSGINIEARSGDGRVALLLAAGVRQNLSLVRRLVEAGCDVNAKGVGGETALSVAIRARHLDTALYLLNECPGVTVGVTKSSGETNLHEAVRADCVALVRALVEKGCDVNAARVDGERPAHIAAQMAGADVIEALAEYNAEMSARDQRGDAPIHHAVVARTGSDEDASSAILALGRAGADLNARGLYGDTPWGVCGCVCHTGCTPLGYVVEKGDFQLAQALLEAGADVGVKATSTHLPLSLLVDRAFCKEMPESAIVSLVSLLIAWGSPVNISPSALHQAARHDASELTQFLLESGVEVDCVEGHPPTTALRVAIANQAVAAARVLLEGGASLTAAERGRQESCLMLTSAKGNLAMMELLLSYQTTTVTALVLHEAIFSGGADMVDLLLTRSDVDVMYTSRDGRTSLHDIAVQGDVRMLRSMLALPQHPDLHAVDDIGMTAFHVACSRDNCDMVRELVSLGARADTCSTVVNTPLHALCYSTKATDEDITLVVSAGGDVDASNRFGVRPLHAACKMGMDSHARLLLVLGATVSARNDKGETPLFTHCANSGADGFNEHLLEVLCQAGACLNEAQDKGVTPLHAVAMSCGTDEGVLALVRRGAAVNVVDEGGDTPLHRAVAAGQMHNVRALLRVGGVERNPVNADGHTPLTLACSRGLCTPDMLTVLLENGCGSNVAGRWGPPLVVCVKGHHQSPLSKTRLLFNHSADPNGCGPDGETVLLAALESRAVEVVKELVQRGADVHTRSRQDTTVTAALRTATKSLELFQILLPLGGDCDGERADGMSPIALVTTMGQGEGGWWAVPRTIPPDVKMARDLLGAGCTLLPDGGGLRW